MGIELGTAELQGIATKLSSASLDPTNGIQKPFTRVQYQESLDKSRLQFPEQLMSIYHHPIYLELTYEQKWKLSLLETINFFSINIHGERKLVQGLEERLYVQSTIGSIWSVGDYMQHFIHEENAHTHMLAGYCYRYGDGIMKDYAVQVSDLHLSNIGQELLFFGRVFVLESFLDYLNSNAMRDELLDSTARQIHRFHHTEEARHMAFDSAVIRYYANEGVRVGINNELKQIAELLDDYGKLALKSLYSPKIYGSIGLDNAMSIAHEAQAFPARLEVEQAWLSKAKSFLKEVGLS